MYLEQPRYRATSEQVAQLSDLAKRVDLAPGPGGSRITPLIPVLAIECARILDGFLSDQATERVQFIALYPSSQLVAHRDPPIAGRRFHIPIVVNDGCWVFHGGSWQQLEIGHCYAMDPTDLHGAVNWGPTVRMHLMVDRPC